MSKKQRIRKYPKEELKKASPAFVGKVVTSEYIDGSEQIPEEDRPKIANNLIWKGNDLSKPKKPMRCPYCGGSGKTYGWECPACKGHKIVDPDSFKYVEGIESR